MKRPESPVAAQLPALDRRALLRTGLLGAGLAAAPLSAQLGARGFTHGVASGEPGRDRVLLWTRYAAAQDVPLAFELSDTLDFARKLGGGTVTASPGNDGCCKAWATGLAPDRWYYYRFVAPDGSMSDTGRTRTLPDGPTARFRMAVFSCSNLRFGWFNAYAHAAEAGDFDLALHLGDYFSEYAADTYPPPGEPVAGRNIAPDNEIVALADYRLRHASYRADRDLQRLTQLYPMIFTWDDHESANDSWKGGAQNHQPETEGPWDMRKAAAMRAYREWLPVSDEPYATYEIGDLATLFRLETRLTGRDEPFDFAAILAGKATPQAALAALTSFREGAWRDPARSMLGAAQERWLSDGFARSVRGGTRWQVLVNQVLMGSFGFSPEFVAAGAAGTPAQYRTRLAATTAVAATGLPASMDMWDGYPAARDRLLASAQEAGANLVVLAGDSHNAWGFELEARGAPAGVEFGGTSVTSPGFETTLAWVPTRDFERAAVRDNPQLKWADFSHRGYMAVELTPTAATCEHRFLDTVRQRSTALAGTHRMATAHGSNRFTT